MHNREFSSPITTLFDGSDDELGMEDEEPFDYEPPFEPLEVDDDLELGKVLVHVHMFKENAK